MTRFSLLLALLAAMLLVACPTSRRGGGGDDDDDSADDDDAADDDDGADDDDAASDDDDASAETTHWGSSAGTIMLNEMSNPCSGQVELALDSDGISAGWADCETDSGWSCTAVWTGGNVLSESMAEEASFDCQGPGPGGNAEGEVWLWGNEYEVSGQFSAEGGVFDYVSVNFDALLPG